ncbi:MAG: hypothetical protein M1820_006600 [Bogoriella megaspora]|nr:MAG: hypothetical protein M1820_006600 [Bogoriella megaspora]
MSKVLKTGTRVRLDALGSQDGGIPKVLNFFAYLLPALYQALSKLWIANIDSNMVALADTYTYVSSIAQVFNDGLPQAVWMIIGDKSLRTFSARLGLTHTLIAFQSLAGLIISLTLLALAPNFISAFVPADIRAASLTYVRITAFAALSSTIETSVNNSTRALDMSNVPFIISSFKFVVNILLDLVFISKVHVHSIKPTANTQAVIRLVCDMTSALIGLAYFFGSTAPYWKRKPDHVTVRPSYRALWILVKAGFFTFTESAVRYAINLWLVKGINSVSLDYATAWGLFITIRMGLVMVPVDALQASNLTFVGHAWGSWRKEVGADELCPRASRQHILRIIKPVLWSLVAVLAYEIPISFFFRFFGCEKLALYLSGSKDVAQITARMWQTIGWYIFRVFPGADQILTIYRCYIFLVLAIQLGVIFLATRPPWYLYQSLIQNMLYMLPWAIALQLVHLNSQNAWSYHRFVYGGELIVVFVGDAILAMLWYWKLRTGRLKLSVVRSTEK